MKHHILSTIKEFILEYNELETKEERVDFVNQLTYLGWNKQFLLDLLTNIK